MDSEEGYARGIKGCGEGARVCPGVLLVELVSVYPAVVVKTVLVLDLLFL